MPTLDDLTYHEAAHAWIAHQRGVAVKSITVMAGAGPDDWAGVVEAPGSAGFSKAVIELAGPVMDLRRSGGRPDDWDADRLKALRALDGNIAVLDEAVRVAGDEVDSVRHRIEKLAAALRSYVEQTGTDLLGCSRLDGKLLDRAFCDSE